ncbi:hypothetical protein BWI17_05670 [Betaproteobacteria bacterium GR16-43]|nr:hypothetical protein BWI17_05670 [Betaproteobacteria bacterium GR16-43]
MFATLGRWITRWRESAEPHVGLDSLVARAAPEASVEERLAWLYDVMTWILAPATGTRLKLLLAALDRSPERKLAFAAAFRNTVGGRDALDLLTETGLPREAGLVGEFVDRILSKVLPSPPPRDLAALFVRVFPDRDDASDLESIPEDVWLSALGLLEHGADMDSLRPRLRLAVEDALESLAVQVAAATQASGLRRRMQDELSGPSATETLPFVVERFIEARRRDEGAIEAEARALHEALGQSLLAVERGYASLHQRGVSIGIVYQFERVRAQLQRTGELAQLLAEPARARVLLRFFLASLVRDVHDQRSVRTLVHQAGALLARKIVERNAETGEHYIARDAKEYVRMIARAMGGGALTAITVQVKFLLGHAKLPAFFEGFFASVNYATSFVAIQLCGFTLATKQPAMTAPALAQKMKGLDDPERMRELVDEVVDLVRSQSAAIFGNLLAVAPVALLLNYLLSALLGAPLIDAEKAMKTMHSISIVGPAVLFAAFTGVLLWLSSVFAGWVENWFYYRELPLAIASHRRLAYVVGPSGAVRVSKFFEDHIAGLAGNVSLGFMLGSIPVILAFYGLPIEVRHVTLSTGQLASAVGTLGFATLETRDFWLAVAGIAGIGVMNLGVSFALALHVAVRARELPVPGQMAMYGAILKRMARRPLSFLVVR